VAAVAGTILSAGAYSVLSLLDTLPMNVPIFLGWLFALVTVNGVLLLLLWRRREGLGIEARMTALYYGAITLWYWLPAPIYFLLTMNIDLLQLRWTAFAYFWEVPVVGGAFILVAQRLFRPLRAFLRGKRDFAEPLALYRLALRYPILVAVLTVVFTVAGYGIGALQLRFLAFLPAVEQLKNVLHGLMISLFLCVFYYLVLDRLLGSVRAAIAKEFALVRVITRAIERRIFGASLVITLGGLALLSLVVFQAFQRMIHEAVREQLTSDLGRLSAELRTGGPLASVAWYSRGERGRVLVLPPGKELSPADYSPETRRSINEQKTDIVEDLRRELKLVGWLDAPASGGKIVSVVFLTDFYGPLRTAAGYLGLVGIFVLALSVGMVTFSSGATTKAIRSLSSAVRRAEGGTADEADLRIDTGDEIEELSRVFARYVRQSRDLREVLESQVQEKTRELSAKLGEIERAQQHLRVLVEHLPDGVLLLDEEQRIVLANPPARVFLPLLAEIAADGALVRIAGRPIDELLQAQPDARFHEVMVGGTRPQIYQVGAARLGVPRASGCVVVLRDVTLERETQRAAQQHARLAAVGQLAAGIAQDLNNILTSILSAAELLKRPGQDPDATRRRLTLITDQGLRATGLIRQILDFSRQSAPILQPVNLGSLLGDTIALLERTLPREVRLVREVAPAAYAVSADPNQLAQVLTNLTLNARDAMPGGGTLSFRLRRLRISGGEAPPLSALAPGDWVALAVGDTGTGIPPEIRERIFEPFFTTKAPGQGAGLGLSQAYGIIQQHQGHIVLESEIGKGTTFTVFLPAHRTEALEGPEAAPAPPPMGRGETLLVLEDESVLRETLCEWLETLNYRVLPAANAAEALTAYHRHSGKIDLVLTDLTIPGIGGLELLQALRRNDPTVRVIGMSGGLTPEARRSLEAHGVIDWIQKPPVLTELARTIQGVLVGQRS
jgi:signal transduction histidine kinase